jgi:hypothetical protein
MTVKIGAFANFATDATSSFDGSSEPFEFISESIKKQGQILDTSGLRGTRSHNVARTRIGPYTVGGSVVINPSPNDLDIWLPRILGAAESVDVFNVAETLPTFSVLVNRVASHGTNGGMQYDDCIVSRATFRSSQGGFLELEIEIVGKTETVDVAFPSLTLGVTDADKPYVHTDAVLTLQSATRQMQSVEVIIDNVVESTFHNSISATDVDPTDRIITVRAEVSWQDANAQALYEQALAGAAAILKYTGVSGTIATTIDFATLQFPDVSPNVSGKGRIPYNLEMISRISGANPDIKFTNVLA